MLVVALGLASLCLSGCSHLRLAVAGSLIEDVAVASSKHDDVDLVVGAAPTYILLLEGLLEGDPDNQNLLISAAETYTSYAVLVEIEDPARAGRLYARAKEYGLRALRRDSKVASLLEAPYDEFATIATSLEDGDLALVFWAASSWGAWIATHTESMSALAELPRVILLMEWVLERDESFNFASPHIFLGTYRAAIPPLLGGEPERARHHFERALELTERRALMVQVQMARYYARQIFDRELYESLLREVITSPADAVPELTLQNCAAQRLAQTLLEEADDYF
ncbi:TRAP transporter TatT component family protein [Candidatus Latescibacterota bacterium]